MSLSPLSSSVTVKTPTSALHGDDGMPHAVETDRERAKREAKECLQAVGQEGFQLDGFNLLGVVANPRAGMSGPSRHNHPSSASASATSPTRPGSDPSRQANANNNNANDEASSDMFSGAVYSLEFTLGQVTEQIESLNLFLEELSRQYLGDDAGEAHFLEYYYQDEEDTREEPPVPSHLANLQIAELQSYLEQCGELAHGLFTQGLETTSLPPPTSPTTAAAGAMIASVAEDDWNEVPSLFFDDDFDLTHSDTFVQLLLLQDHTSPPSTATNTTTSKNSLYQPTGELIPARDQDVLAGHLDRVELALQEQVRLKAGMFFQETTRFRQLQASIEELLEQVQTLRHDIRAVLSVYRQTKDISNHQRQDYELLVQLVDAANNLIQTKASIGGLLSANDQLGAAQQIQYGRRLLRQGIARVEDHPTNMATTDLSAANGSSGGSTHEPLMQLQSMLALSSCEAQFQQYESLVVQSLSEEMVDTFFNWKPTDNKSRVHEMLQALNLCQALDKTGDLYNRRLQQTIRMTVRTTIAEFVESSGTAGSGVTGMTYQDFFSCLELLMEELQSVLHMARQVDQFAMADAIFPQPEKRWTNEALVVGADLATKSIAELLRLRKEAHSLITLDEMRQLWDTCLKFTLTIEDYGNNIKAVGLRSTLVGQAKAFLDRTHESNMSALVAALDSERWMPCEVSSERQAALTRLCTGRVLVTAVKRSPEDTTTELNNQKRPTAEVEGVQYKVVWSSLLLVEMIMTNLLAAGHFQSLATNAITKVAELLRLFNTRTTNLVLGAGAIHSAARLKSINAKHLSMVTQCLGMMTALLPHIRAALMSQLPPKQHALLNDLDKIKKDYLDHNEKVLNKFVTIIGGIVEHGLAPRIAHTDFDARAKEFSSQTNEITCCVFLDGICSNARKMHQVLSAMLPPDHLQDVFSRIFAYVDQKVPTLLIAAASSSSSNTATPNGNATFRLPSTNDGKRRLIMEVKWMTVDLNSLEGVLPWDFTCTNFLERKLDVEWPQESVTEQEEEPVDSSDDATDEVPKESSPEEKESSIMVSSNGASVSTPTVENGKSPDLPLDDSS